MNEKAIWKLEALIEQIKGSNEAFLEIAEQHRKDTDTFTKGIASGIQIVSDNNKRYIKKLETVLSELNGFMEEDVNLSGSEEIA